ncbi:hypothetical protein [Streptomyces sp. NPDC127072]|uniref:hypothetical protein n=1 Tax=unclassified Streptomyces TaxID=2593676 RepID=UPI003665F44A
MLVAAFSAVVAIGAVSGVVGAKSGQGDSTWGASVVATTDQGDGALGPVSPDVADDSTWG